MKILNAHALPLECSLPRSHVQPVLVCVTDPMLRFLYLTLDGGEIIVIEASAHCMCYDWGQFASFWGGGE